jgi:hypothetical protein
MTTVQFKDWRCVISLRSYGDGNTALSLYDADDGMAVSCVSVNLVPVERELLEDRALIYLKDYSENEGMLDLLIEEGIVERTGRTRQSGYIEAPLVRIIDPELVAEINQQGQVCVDCNREADELNSEGRCDDCEAQLDEWEEERKRDGYMEDSPTIEDQHPAYGEHMAEASTSAWDEYWGSKKQS